MNHEAARQRILELAYGELRPFEARRLEAHVRSCPQCREDLDSIAATRAAMGLLEREVAPETGERVLQAAGREAAARMASRTRASATSWLRLAATAALVVVVGGVSWRILVDRRQRPAEPMLEVGTPVGSRPDSSSADRVAAGPAAAEPYRSTRIAEPRPQAPAAAREHLAAGGAPRAESQVAPPRVAASDEARDTAAVPGTAAAPAFAKSSSAAGSTELEVGSAEGAAREVDLLRERGELRLVDDQGRRCGEASLHVEVWRDGTGRARRLVVTSAFGATSRRADLLYDAGGRLRLARLEIEAGDAVSRGRVAFNSSGDRVLAEGAGRAWPDAGLPRRAEAAVAEPFCP